MAVATKILIADDQIGIRMLLKEFFKSEGYDVLIAGNGEQAVEIFAKEAPQLVITDLQMPVMDGLEAISKVRELDQDIPFVLMTAYGELEKVARAQSHGNVEIVRKPFDLEIMAGIVRRMLGAECSVAC